MNQSLTFYVVDDDPLILELAKTLLENAGHRVRCMSSSVQALSDIRTQRPDCVITDIMMPGQDGMATLLEMRSDHPNLPIVVISGDAAEHLELAEQFGATAILSKPFRRAELLETITKALS